MSLGKVLDMQDDELRTGRVSFGEDIREVSLAFVPSVKIGDYVVVQAGTALQVLDEAGAQKALQAMRELEEAENEA